MTAAADPLAPDPPAADPLAADTIAAAVLAVPGVAGLHPGTFGEVATYLPGRRVVGVRRAAGTVEVHVVLRWGVPVLATAEAVRTAVTALGATTVDVAVQDVVGAALPIADDEGGAVSERGDGPERQP